MVGRSKPSTLNRKEKEDTLSNLSVENNILKAKNIELAKELAACKQKCSQFSKENMTMRCRYFEVETLNRKLIEAIRRIENCGKNCLNILTLFSTEFPKILQEAAQFTYAKETTYEKNDVEHINKSDSKTRAVKPMISGHTIARPTITLLRVSTQELEQLANVSDRDVNTEDVEIEDAEIDDSINMNEHANLSENVQMSPISNEQDNGENEGASNFDETEMQHPIYDRLSTLHEESSDNMSSFSNSTSIDLSLVPKLSARCKEFKVSTKGFCETKEPFVKLQPLSTELKYNTQRNTNLSIHLSSLNVSIENSQVSREHLTSPHTLDESLNVSTLVNASFENKTLPDFYDQIENTSQTNIVQGNQEENYRCNTKNNSSDFSNFSTSTIDQRSHKKSSHCLTSNRIVEDSYDPLEGPSTLLDNINLNRKVSHLQGLGLSPVTNTSTPYSPANIAVRRRHNRHLYSSFIKSPFIKERSNNESPNTPPTTDKYKDVLDNTPRPSQMSSIKRSFCHASSDSPLIISRRRRKNPLDDSFSPTLNSINIKSENVTNYSNCSVNIVRLPNSLLKQNVENIAPQETVTRKSSRKRSSLSKRKISPKRNALKQQPAEFSPRKRRQTKIAAGAFKEPSLRKKLRRSK